MFGLSIQQFWQVVFTSESKGVKRRKGRDFSTLDRLVKSPSKENDLCSPLMNTDQ